MLVIISPLQKNQPAISTIVFCAGEMTGIEKPLIQLRKHTLEPVTKSELLCLFGEPESRLGNSDFFLLTVHTMTNLLSQHLSKSLDELPVF
ncbi:hypothetical protein SAMN02745866_00002 [Alteromonadaceae bacterium Bs31]|nr:hypothetical protein SAMN02745866_00002 [Alteromonadaceae bacterium Bs31]